MAETILIVDDDLDTLRMVGLLLQRKGYKIIAASQGKQALEKAESENPDLILLDVMMPDMDGFEVLNQLRSNGSTSDIPIIMFTAKSQVEDKVSGFEAGADDYLTKPTHPAELIARVKTILSRTTAQRRIAEPVTTVSERGKIVGVLAARGGLGVTTVALNLGMTFLNLQDGEVIVADLRPGDGGLSLELGFQLQDGLNQLLSKEPNQISINDVAKEILTHDSGLHLLLSSFQPADAKLSTAVDQAVVITKHLSHLARYTILDLGAALPPIVENVLDECDQLVVVVEPMQNTVIKTKALLDDLSLRVLGLGRITVVMVNRIRSEMRMPLKEVQDKLGHSISIVFTPVPELAHQQSIQNIPMVQLQKEGLAAQQYGKLAEIIAKHAQRAQA